MNKSKKKKGWCCAEPYFDPLCFLDLLLDSTSTGNENPCLAHDDHFEFQVLDLEEGTWPSKKMRYDCEFDVGLNLVDYTFSSFLILVISRCLI